MSNSDLRLVPEELSRLQLFRLAEIAHETPHYDLKKAATALLTTSLFPPEPISVADAESLPTDWGTVEVAILPDGKKIKLQPPVAAGSVSPEVLQLRTTNWNEPPAATLPQPTTTEPSPADVVKSSNRKSPDWSAEEDALLIAFVAANPAPRRWDGEIVKRFTGRTPKALQGRAERLKLRKRNGEKKAPDVREGDCTNIRPSTDTVRIVEAKGKLDEMFPPNRTSAMRAEPKHSKPVIPAAVVTFPPPWEPVETFNVPETIYTVLRWCRAHGDTVTQDGEMFVVNDRRLFASEFVKRASNLRVDGGGKPFDVIIDEAAQ